MADNIVIDTVSSVTLGGQYASYANVFSPLPVNDEEYFDEGPRTSRNRSHVTSSLSGSIDTSAIDAFAQGVEITNQARYDAGLVKIWSGEPGHKLLITRYGEDRQFFPNVGFTEVDVFDPLRYIEAVQSPLVLLPYLLGDEDQTTDFNLNGVIEILAIRRLQAYEDHDVHGSFGEGNISLKGSEQVLTVDAVSHPLRPVAFFDATFVQPASPALAPFLDARFVRNVPPSDDPEPTDISEAMSLMTGSTGGYIAHNQRSSPCGWDYDNTVAVGTDSLAFGGMTY